MAELHGEKIDIVDFSEDSAQFVANALSPARVSRVIVVDAQARVAQVIVPDYQLSLAIGKEGQNARLAARLTGWKIDIRPDTAADGPSAAGGPAPAPVAAAAGRPEAGSAGPSEAGSAGTAPDPARPAGAPGAGHGAADAPAR
jgi:N utilization substance protein A